VTRPSENKAQLKYFTPLIKTYQSLEYIPTILILQCGKCGKSLQLPVQSSLKIWHCKDKWPLHYLFRDNFLLIYLKHISPRLVFSDLHPSLPRQQVPTQNAKLKTAPRQQSLNPKTCKYCNRY
jgi:hypothetical protein